MLVLSELCRATQVDVGIGKSLLSGDADASSGADVILHDDGASMSSSRAISWPMRVGADSETKCGRNASLCRLSQENVTLSTY